MITGVQIRAARGITRWSTAELAARAQIARSTVIRAEGYDGAPAITRANLTAMQTALEAAGVYFGDGGTVGYHPDVSCTDSD
ncbi:XRE family transcriptional regulator [Acidiphilium sp. PA]|uniref:XRE family transcriptional regulator n=1 Tax=Acidiphilium sp. PA TaxID=2871705 RepID=UPI0022443235|nr:XRE family transcriptional regulator [Acidiphilium sp. PA]MCW8306877.1 XRE family transcriptional regulator [Acidiphilium sp. PA]